MSPIPVRFEPSGCVVWVDAGTTVLDAALRAGVPIAAPCGGRGVCGACGVRVLDGALAEPDREERIGLSRAPAEIRLACRARIEGPVTLRPVIGGSRTPPAVGVTAPRLFAAVDLGTTTVVAAVLDPATGRELGRAAVPNAQRSFGADILTRVSAALAGGSSQLTQAAQGSVLTALRSVTADTRAISRLVIAGNTAMSALLVGAEVTGLASYPFDLPQHTFELPAQSLLRCELADDAEVLIVPAIGGFVGGDVLAGMLATGIAAAGRPRLLLDLGTNAEVVLEASGRLWAASAAAGPAFEGSGIRCGSVAAPGAVSAVRLVGDGLEIATIDDEPPVALSGAGLLSVLALLLRLGHLRSDGLLVADGPLAQRFGVDSAGVVCFSVSDGADCLTVDQLDVRTLQLAKGAVRAAVESVLAAAHVEAGSLDRLYVAGAFGGALDVRDLVDLGIVPRRAAEVVEIVGNSSLDGALALAFDPEAVCGAEKAARAAIHVDLASDPAFARALMAATALEPY